MDQSFFLRAKRLLERPPEPLSHHALLAQLADQRTDLPTVKACAEPAPAPCAASDTDAISTLLLGEPAWPVAARIQRGCFNRASAIRPVHTR